MAQQEDPHWNRYVAVSTAIIAVLAAIVSLHASSYSSLMLEEKNNSILFQNKANKEWNNYLAGEIARNITGKKSGPALAQQEQEFKAKANNLEAQGAAASNKFQTYFEKNSHLVSSGTFFEVGIALSAMSILIRKKYFWIFSLLLAGVGVYFLVIGLI